MKKLPEYSAAEPDQISAFLDQKGNFHATRDEAIDANFADDFHIKCMEIIEDHKRFHAIPILTIADFVTTFIELNPDLVRVVLGDRGAT